MEQGTCSYLLSVPACRSLMCVCVCVQTEGGGAFPQGRIQTSRRRRGRASVSNQPQTDRGDLSLRGSQINPVKEELHQTTGFNRTNQGRGLHGRHGLQLPGRRSNTRRGRRGFSLGSSNNTCVCVCVQVDPSEEPLQTATLHQMLQDLVTDEETVILQIRGSKNEVTSSAKLCHSSEVQETLPTGFNHYELSCVSR